LLINDWTDHAEQATDVAVELLPGREYEIEFDQYDTSWAVCTIDVDLDQKDFNAAKEVAARNDVVILVIGTSPPFPGRS